MYESEETLMAEEEVKRKIEAQWKIKLIKLPVKTRFDFFMKGPSGEGIGFAEVKCRSCKKSDYATYMLSLDKFLHGKKFTTYLTRENGRPMAAILFVRWRDEDGYYQITKDSTVQVDIGGRTDRGDTRDTEPVAHISIREFKKF